MEEGQKKKVLLGVSGSIAVFKSLLLVKRLEDKGMDVRIILSRASQEFVSLLTWRTLFPGRVISPQDSLDASDRILHIEWVRWCDIFLVAPASADALARFSNGLGGELLFDAFLASYGSCARFVAPAMNQAMWNAPSTQRNIRCLQEDGVIFLGPVRGSQACGEEGFGRFIDLDMLMFQMQKSLTPQTWRKKKVLITGGGTHESIDPVRFIANRSSGKMACAFARHVALRGGEVTFVAGANLAYQEVCCGLVKKESVESARHMYDACMRMMREAHEEGPPYDIFFSIAAVGDYRPVYSEHKIKKRDGTLLLTFESNPDILHDIKRAYPELFCVGFAAESQNLLEEAQKKITSKCADLLIANDISQGKVFSRDQAQVYIVRPEHPPICLETLSKDEIASYVLTFIEQKRFLGQR